LDRILIKIWTPGSVFLKTTYGIFKPEDYIEKTVIHIKGMGRFSLFVFRFGFRFFANRPTSIGIVSISVFATHHNKIR